MSKPKKTAAKKTSAKKSVTEKAPAKKAAARKMSGSYDSVRPIQPSDTEKE